MYGIVAIVLNLIRRWSAVTFNVINFNDKNKLIQFIEKQRHTITWGLIIVMKHHSSKFTEELNFYPIKKMILRSP